MSRLCLVAGLMGGIVGCGPNQANVQLRRQNQQLSQKVDDLERRNSALAAQLTAEESHGGSTTQQLSEARLASLYTVSGIGFGKSTGGFAPDINGPDQLLKVAICPTDQDGEALKAAGSFKIELFDLAEPDTRIGTWNFTAEEAKTHWYGRFMLYTYLFDLPWQTVPKHSKLVVQATFTDELTGRQFQAKRDIEVRLAADSH